MKAGYKIELPQSITGHRHTRLLFKELQDAIGEAPSGAGLGPMRCCRDLEQDFGAATYQSYILQIREQAGLSADCEHCHASDGRVIRFVASDADGQDGCCFAYVTCKTCGDCQRVEA